MNATTRTDVHCPSNINPADYVYFEEIYHGMPADLAAGLLSTASTQSWYAAQQLLREEIKAKGWKGGNYARKGTCDHCGAAFNYGVVYTHLPTKELVVVGWICAGKTMDIPDRATLDHKRMVERIASVRESIKNAAAIAYRWATLQTKDLALYNAFQTCQHPIVLDIKGRFEKWGNYSPKQAALVLKLANPQPKAAEPTWLPVEAGRRDVEGTVLTVKTQASGYGVAWKMLLRVDHPTGAEKIWTTIPAQITDTLYSKDGHPQPVDSLRGKRVAMTLTVIPSDRDCTFGIGKRPTNGRVIQEDGMSSVFSWIADNT